MAYLHPAVTSVYIFMTNVQLVPTLRNKVPHSFQELVVIRCANKETVKQFFDCATT